MSRFERKAERPPAVVTMKENRIGRGWAVIQKRWWIENSGTDSGGHSGGISTSVGGWRVGGREEERRRPGG